MQTCSSENCKMEQLMTGSAVVVFAGGTALGASDHVNDGALDVDVATDRVNITAQRSDIFLHEYEHDEH